MSMFGGMEISASALTAQRLRINVTAENLANAQTTKTADGTPYRRKEVYLEAVPKGGFGAQLSKAMGGGSGVGVGGPHLSRPRRSPKTRRTGSSSTTPVTPTPTSRATCACRTSTRSPRWWT